MAFDLTIKIGGESGEGVISAGDFLTESAARKMSTFGIHRLDWLMVSKRFPWNTKYETVYRWFASFIVIYTIMDLKS